MNNQEISDRIFELITKYSGKARSELSLETRLIKDLDFKSANYFPLIMELEEIFDLEIQFAEFRARGMSIAGIIDFITEQIQ